MQKLSELPRLAHIKILGELDQDLGVHIAVYGRIPHGYNSLSSQTDLPSGLRACRNPAYDVAVQRVDENISAENGRVKRHLDLRSDIEAVTRIGLALSDVYVDHQVAIAARPCISLAGETYALTLVDAGRDVNLQVLCAGPALQADNPITAADSLVEADRHVGVEIRALFAAVGTAAEIRETAAAVCAVRVAVGSVSAGMAAAETSSEEMFQDVIHIIGISA